MFYWMLQRWLFYLSPCFEVLFTSTLPGDTSAICCSIWKSITEKTNDYSVVKFPPTPSRCSALESSQLCLQITGLCLCWLLCFQHNYFFWNWFESAPWNVSIKLYKLFVEPTFNFNAHNRGKLALELRTVAEIKISEFNRCSFSEYMKLQVPKSCSW